MNLDDFYDKDMNDLKLEEARLQEMEMELKYFEQFTLEGNEDIEEF